MSQSVPSIALNNGAAIPQLGFGVFQIDPDETAQAVQAALAAGYRHIDTAQMYQNERGVGEGLRASGIDRDEVFITTKVNNNSHDPDDATKSVETSLSELGLEHVDLLLIHWPLPDVGDYVETWKALEEVYRSGRARSIGVSNFQPHHLRRLLAETDVVPVVNQVEVHPYFVQDEVRAVNAEHQVVTEAWSPIAQGGVLGDPVVERVAGEVDRTPAQVVLRWHVQRGDVIFPKSTNPDRMKENFALFDFELTGDQMTDISSLDKADGRTGPDPDTFNMVP